MEHVPDAVFFLLVALEGNTFFHIQSADNGQNQGKGHGTEDQDIIALQGAVCHDNGCKDTDQCAAHHGSQRVENGQVAAFIGIRAHNWQQTVFGDIHDIKGPAQQQIGSIDDRILSHGAPHCSEPEQNVVNHADHGSQDQHRAEFPHFCDGEAIQNKSHQRIVESVHYLGDQKQRGQCGRVQAYHSGVIDQKIGTQQRHQRDIARADHEITQLFR